MLKFKRKFRRLKVKQAVNKYGKVAIPENGQHPKVCCSVNRTLRCMRGIFLTTAAAGFATLFRFNIIPPNDSNPKELYHPVTVFSAYVFIFFLCCVIKLLFLQIEIFYLQTWILILKLPNEAPLDCFGLSALSTVPTNHHIGQVISALLAKTHPSGCKRSRCNHDSICGQGPEYCVNEPCRVQQDTSQRGRSFTLPLTKLMLSDLHYVLYTEKLRFQKMDTTQRFAAV